MTSWISLCICSGARCHANVTSGDVNRCTLTPERDGESRGNSRDSRRTFAWGRDLWTWRECWRRGVASAASCFPCFRRTASVAGCLSVLRRLSAVKENDRWRERERRAVSYKNVIRVFHAKTLQKGWLVGFLRVFALFLVWKWSLIIHCTTFLPTAFKGSLWRQSKTASWCETEPFLWNCSSQLCSFLQLTGS